MQANRLSARSSNQVLLLEAGVDTPHNQVPEEIVDSYPGKVYFNPKFIWNGLRVHIGPQSHNNPDERRPQSNTSKLASWAAVPASTGNSPTAALPPTMTNGANGGQGWSWEASLPYFKKIERDLDFDDEYHGQEGRIPVSASFRISGRNM